MLSIHIINANEAKAICTQIESQVYATAQRSTETTKNNRELGHQGKLQEKGGRGWSGI